MQAKPKAGREGRKRHRLTARLLSQRSKLRLRVDHDYRVVSGAGHPSPVGHQDREVLVPRRDVISPLRRRRAALGILEGAAQRLNLRRQHAVKTPRKLATLEREADTRANVRQLPWVTPRGPDVDLRREHRQWKGQSRHGGGGLADQPEPVGGRRGEDGQIPQAATFFIRPSRLSSVRPVNADAATSPSSPGFPNPAGIGRRRRRQAAGSRRPRAPTRQCYRRR